MHKCNCDYLYLLLFRPVKKDICDRCLSWETARKNTLNPPTAEQRKAYDFHWYQADCMKSRMKTAEEACSNETKKEKQRRLRKEKAQKRAQENLCEEAPSEETKKKRKPKRSKEIPPENPCEYEDMVAHIATDMMQIQSVPKTQNNSAYYKSKVNNEISLNNALIIIMPL